MGWDGQNGATVGSSILSKKVDEHKHKILQLMMGVLSHFSHVRLFTSLWTVAQQAPLSMEYSRQEN